MDIKQRTTIHRTITDSHNGSNNKQKVNPHKAEGPDHIPTRFLEEFAAKLPSAMTLMFQSSLQPGEVPDDWKQANIAPILKKETSQYCSKLRAHFADISVQQDPGAHHT